MTRIDPELVTDLKERLGAITPVQADAVLGTTLHVLAASLPRRLAEQLAAALPKAAAALVRAVEPGGSSTAADLFEAIAARDRLPKGRAIEAGEAACALLGARLSPELSPRLARELDPSLAALLRAVAAPKRPERERKVAPGGKLSTGRAGAARPVAGSELAGPRAHEHRLATSRGTRQEEAGETLARGGGKKKR
jgi:uncharacterized protein (DUF2267 family)